ncbi:Uncharacterised protein [Vibrio cholerae]|nr:Uncharacterised protein [Vibrio cholerae]
MARRGEILLTSSGLPDGKKASRRLTPAWHNQDLALATRRIGVFEPKLRAIAPTSAVGSLLQGKRREAAAISCSWG